MAPGRIRDVAVDDPQPVDLEIEGNDLERRLPSAVLQGDLVRRFRLDLREIRGKRPANEPS